MTTKADHEEHARLVMMDQDTRSVSHYVDCMRDEYPGIPLIEILGYWEKYRGIDRRLPTHDLETGKPRTR